ncbi:MAG TPA: PKD domain-containing protein [Bacteroidia bacterium]|jgi:hypothetical protein|nr:PKD domain-containing protein [Bacteroidia bacterium]
MRARVKHSFLLLFLIIAFFQCLAQNKRNGFPETLHLPPQSEFSWTNACYKDTTHFINETLRGNYYWWTIFNMSMDTLYKSTNTNINFLFALPGTYYVTLEAHNGHVSLITDTIVIDSITKADFLFMHCSNHFVNHSTCASSFKWNFGDGTTSTSELPVHQYADTGHYTVSLIASNGINSDTTVKQIFVDLTHFPTADFTYRQSHDTVFFHAVDTDKGLLYSWVFGNYKYGTRRDTFTVYPDTGGIFIVTLLAYDHCFHAGHTDTIRIKSGIPYNFSNSSLLALPNPAVVNSDLNLLYNSAGANNATLHMYNTLGQTVLENDYSFHVGLNQFKVPINNLAEGIYYLILQGDVIKSGIKFLISH